MIDVVDLNELVIKLQSGEEVLCPLCNSGNIVQVENGYACENCNTKINES